MAFFSFDALNALSSNDAGRFVYLDAWSYNAYLSILDEVSPLYWWEDTQSPLLPSERDDLQAKLALAEWQMMNSLVGMIYPVMTQTPPPGTLLCDGATYARSDYPLLYAKCDAAFIIDADFFRVPDLRGQFIRGADLGISPGDTGGEAEHTQTIDEMPLHGHSTDPHAHSEVTAVPAIINGGLEAPASAAVPGAGTTGLATVTIHQTGGGNPFPIIPPFLALNYVVVAS